MPADSFFLLAASLVGLAVGSFLNVLIHRLPRMIEQAMLPPDTEPARALNLAFPSSHCPACLHPIAWHDNIPLLGFVLLRGRCRHCGTAISWQYPLVELATAALFVWAWLAHGNTPSAIAWAGFAATLLALAVIDARTTWLPDALTQPLTWAGLIASALGWTGVGLDAAVAGAVAGYLSLWLVYWSYRLCTGQEGMGHGDFKLMAALGAWFGWQALLAVLLMASLSALAFALWQLQRRRLAANRAIAFGPFLALAGGWLMFFGAPAPLRW